MVLFRIKVRTFLSFRCVVSFRAFFAFVSDTGYFFVLVVVIYSMEALVSNAINLPATIDKACVLLSLANVIKRMKFVL